MSTSGRSNPRAATSVASNREGESGVDGCKAKADKVDARLAGVRWPCRV